MTPEQILDLVKDNVVVQWFLVIVFILTVSTTTATKISGPIGKFARWARSIGEKRDEREAAERREKRLKLIQEAQESSEYVEREMDQLREQMTYLYDNQHKLEGLIRVHLGWDFDRVQQLIQTGVRPGDIPSPPPLRIELRDPNTVPQPKVSARRRHRAETGENVQVPGKPDTGR